MGEAREVMIFEIRPQIVHMRRALRRRVEHFLDRQPRVLHSHWCNLSTTYTNTTTTPAVQHTTSLASSGSPTADSAEPLAGAVLQRTFPFNRDKTAALRRDTKAQQQVRACASSVVCLVILLLCARTFGCVCARAGACMCVCVVHACACLLVCVCSCLCATKSSNAPCHQSDTAKPNAKPNRLCRQARMRRATVGAHGSPHMASLLHNL